LNDKLNAATDEKTSKSFKSFVDEIAAKANDTQAVNDLQQLENQFKNPPTNQLASKKHTTKD